MSGSWIDSFKAWGAELGLALGMLTLLVVAMAVLSAHATTAEAMAMPTASSQTDGHPINHHEGADAVCHLAVGCVPVLAASVGTDVLWVAVDRVLASFGEPFCRGRFLPPDLKPPIV